MDKEKKISNKMMREDLKCDIPVVLIEHSIITKSVNTQFFFTVNPTASTSFSCTNLPSSGHMYQKI